MYSYTCTYNLFSNWLVRLQPEKLTIWGDGMAQWCASACSHAAWVGCLKDGWLTLEWSECHPKIDPMTNDFWMFFSFINEKQWQQWSNQHWRMVIWPTFFFRLGVYFLTPNHWILKSLIHCRFLNWDLRILSEDHTEMIYYVNFQICTNWWFGIGKFFHKGHDIVILGMYLYKRGTYSFIVCNLYFYTFAGLD